MSINYFIPSVERSRLSRPVNLFEKQPMTSRLCSKAKTWKHGKTTKKDNGPLIPHFNIKSINMVEKASQELSAAASEVGAMTNYRKESIYSS